MFNLISHIYRQRAFSKATFGPGPKTEFTIGHMRKCLNEIEESPSDCGNKWIDVILLALDGAWRCGSSPEGIVLAIDLTQGVEENREWPDWRTGVFNKQNDSIAFVRDDHSANAVAHFAWVIEHCQSEPGRPRYFTGHRHPALRWTNPSDHKEACRFARKEDAERIAELVGFYEPNPTHRICQHGFAR